MHEAEYSAISFEALAARIGVSRPTLYRRFENRDALVKALVEREFAILFEREENEDDDEAGQDDDPLALLRAHARQMFEFFVRPRTANFVTFLIQESLSNPRLVDARQEWHRRATGRLIPLIERAQRQGVFVPQDPGRQAALLIALLDTPVHLHMMGFDRHQALSGLSEEDYFAWRYSIFLDAVRASDPGFRGSPSALPVRS